MISFWFLFGLWLVYWSVCVVVLWVWWGMGKDRRRKRLLLLLFFFTLPCVGIVCGEEWGREDFCVRGMCGVCWQACAWGIACCRPVFGVFCGPLARFLVPVGSLYVFPEKVSQSGFLEALAIFCLFVGFAYLPHILSLCLGWGRCMFYIRTHAEGDTHIEDVRFVRGGV